MQFVGPLARRGRTPAAARRSWFVIAQGGEHIGGMRIAAVLASLVLVAYGVVLAVVGRLTTFRRDIG